MLEDYGNSKNVNQHLISSLKIKSWFFLQETHLNDQDVTSWRQEWGWDIYCSGHDSKSRGTAIAINPKLEYKIEKHSTDNEGRLVCLWGSVRDRKVLLCNIYAPNTDDPMFFHDMISHMEEYQDTDVVILGGDFNLVMNTKVDRLKSDYNHTSCANILTEFVETTQLIDIWRVRNPEKVSSLGAEIT